MNTMKDMPGFTADNSLYKTRRRYQSVANQGYTSGGQGVVAQQLTVGGVGGRGLGLHWPSWCELKCAAVAAACIFAWGATGAGAATWVLAEIACLSDCND
jgi:hypothetical protein